MVNKIKVDRRRVENLSVELLQVIKAYYEREPIERARVFEALNALAAVTGLIVHATDQRALNFFLDALSENLRSPKEDGSSL